MKSADPGDGKGERVRAERFFEASSELPALPFTAMLFQVASPVFSRLRNCKLKN